MNPITIAITLFKVFTARKGASNSIGDVKQWYQSKGITGPVVAILGTIATWYGLDVPIEQLEVTITALGTIIANVVGIMGRINAKSEINK